MQITADINTDDIVAEITESVDFDRHVNDLVDSLLNDQIEEHLSRLDIDDIEGFESRAEEIARDVVSQILDDEIGRLVDDAVSQAMADAPDPQDNDDRITDLENKVATLTEALQSMAAVLDLGSKAVANIL